MNENGQLPERFTISGELLQATLNYLATLPYAQVATLIQELSNCEPVAEPVPEVEDANSS